MSRIQETALRYLGEDGSALRNLQEPKQCFTTINGRQLTHPEHRQEYHDLGEEDDWGGIHINCGIHNKAAYNILNSQLFDIETASNLFYQALKLLSPQSDFSHSRRRIQQVAKTLFRTDPLDEKKRKLEVIAQAFDLVGIE